MLYESSYLRLECRDRVATLWLDPPSQVLSTAVLNDLDHALSVVRNHPTAEVLVVRSSHATHFLCGPDLDEVMHLANPGERYRFAELGQRVLGRLAGLSPKIRTIAYIEGRCLNAGLELALACDYRLAVARPETLIGFDGLERGLFPCWGGLQRLAKLVGPTKAFEFLHDGQLLPARAARDLGLVNHAFGARPATSEVRDFITQVLDETEPRRVRRKRSVWTLAHETRLFCGPLLFRRYERRLTRRDHRAALKAVECGWRQGMAAGELAERAGFVAACADPHVRLRLQHARRRLALLPEHPSTAYHCGIVGMHTVGIELALLAMRFGHSVVLHESDPGQRNAGRQLLKKGLQQSIRDGWFTIVEAEQELRNTIISKEPAPLASAELVLATGPVELQRRTLAALDAQLPPDVVLVATAPQTAAVAHRLTHPDRLVVAQFENSLLHARTVNVAFPEGTAVTATQRLMQWLDSCGKWAEPTEAVAVSVPAVFAA